MVAAPAGQAGGLLFARCRGSGGRFAGCSAHPSRDLSLSLGCLFLVFSRSLSAPLLYELPGKTGRSAVAIVRPVSYGAQGCDYPRDEYCPNLHARFVGRAGRATFALEAPKTRQLPQEPPGMAQELQLFPAQLLV